MSKKYLKLSIDGWWTQDPEKQERFNQSLVTPEKTYHEVATYYITCMTIKYKNTDTMSLDEYLCEYSDSMHYEDVKLGESILKLFNL
jgi:hypothetical protein